MAPVICPTCRTALSLPPQVQLANMLCPRCKNPLAGAAASAAPPPHPSSGGNAPASSPFSKTPAAATQTMPSAGQTLSGFPGPTGLSTGPKRYGVLTASLLVGVLVLGLGLDLFLLSRNSTTPSKEKKEGDGPVHDGKPVRADAEMERIFAAVDKGVAYLKERILVGDTIYYPNDEGGGSSLGPKALAGLTLLECAVPAADPAVAHVAEAVRRDAPTLRYTYSICLAILFLDRLDRELKASKGSSNPTDKKLLEDLALRLIAAQNSTGGWAYNSDLLSVEQQRLLSDQLSRGTASVGTHPSKYDDNSINQFATLALWAARRHGIKVEKSLEMVERRFRANQNPDGSWGYRPGANDLKAATTCAGLIGLAVGRGIIDDKETIKRLPPLTEDDAVKKGLKHLAGIVGKAPARLASKEVDKRRRHAAEMNALNRKWHLAPESRAETEDRIRALDSAEWLGGTFLDVDAWGDLYFLWSVERVGVIYSLSKFGDSDWYAWGVPIILAQQRADGSWHDRFPGVPDTCFALLFLRRANVAQDLTDRLQGISPAPSRKD